MTELSFDNSKRVCSSFCVLLTLTLSCHPLPIPHPPPQPLPSAQVPFLHSSLFVLDHPCGHGCGGLHWSSAGIFFLYMNGKKHMAVTPEPRRWREKHHFKFKAGLKFTARSGTAWLQTEAPAPQKKKKGGKKEKRWTFEKVIFSYGLVHL